MAHDLAGRLAVITGASAGIGEAAAERLAAQGLDLVLGARRVDRLEALAQRLTEAHGVKVVPAALDVCDAASCDAFARVVAETAGDRGVEVLVANAGLARGVARLAEGGEGDEADWETMFDTNVMGTLRVIRRLVPGMVEHGRGTVVTLGSLAGIETYEGGGVYCATKASVRVISRALRLELLGTGVRVCCVNPGMVETEFSVVRFDGDQAKADSVYDGMTPLTGDDIAAAIEWVVCLPLSMNIEEVTTYPTDQVSAQKVHRKG